MKTTNFGTVETSTEPDGSVRLTMFVPGEGTTSLVMTPDELMLFMVEVGNGLALARGIELQKRIERDILHENRKLHSARRGDFAFPWK